MNRIALIILFLLPFSSTYSQNRFSIETGVGQPSFGLHLSETDIYHTPRPSVPVEVSYLRKLEKHVYAGAKLFFHQYSFDYYYSHTAAGGSYNEGNVITTKSNYLFIAPTLDFGLGRHQYIHCYFSTAIGYLLSGEQRSHDYNSIYGYPHSSYDTVYSSNGYIKGFIFHLNFGFEEHIRLNSQWHILLNEGFSLFSSDMTYLANPGTDVHPGYILLQIGVMRKYNKPVINTDNNTIAEPKEK
jgi:hypothetical protein